MNNFSPSAYAYICDEPMRVRVEATQTVKAMNITGSVELLLIVERNGQNVGQTQFSTGTGYNLLYIKTETLTLSELVSCQKGDRLQIRLIARRQTKLGAYSITVYNNPDNARVTFTPDLTTRMGDTWPVARNLPADITGKNLLITLAHLFGGTWSADSLRRQIRFVSLSETVSNIQGAVDWSNRIDTGVEPKWTPRLEPYAQNNLLRWKELEDTQKEGRTTTGLYGAKTIVAYGDGNLPIQASTLPAETALFELPFAGSINSIDQIPGYGFPVLIKTRSVSRSGGNVTISNSATAPRLLLVEPTEMVNVATRQLKDDGVTSEKVTAELMACWFGTRPLTLGGPMTNFSLLFGQAGPSGEVCLLDRHYQGLRRIVSRMRVLELSLLLSAADISELDLSQPVRLKRLQVGSLTISDGYWYINKIGPYQSGKPCRAVLVGF